MFFSNLFFSNLYTSPALPLNVLCTFNLRPVSRVDGKNKPVFHLQHLIPHCKKKKKNADVLLTNFLVQYNLPPWTIVLANVPDSTIVSKFTCRWTKSTAILNKALPSACLDYLKNHCKTHPFCLGTDGSNDTGILKMNPVRVYVYLASMHLK